LLTGIKPILELRLLSPSPKQNPRAWARGVFSFNRGKRVATIESIETDRFKLPDLIPAVIRLGPLPVRR